VTLRSLEVTIDAVDAEASAEFWRAALGYERERERPPYIVLAPPRGTPLPYVLIQRVEAVTPGKAKVHLDVLVDDSQSEVRRLLGLGARTLWEIDETAEGGSRWTTMADPQGTEFCVVAARDALGDRRDG